MRFIQDNQILSKSNCHNSIGDDQIYIRYNAQSTLPSQDGIVRKFTKLVKLKITKNNKTELIFEVILKISKLLI